MIDREPKQLRKTKGLAKRSDSMNLTEALALVYDRKDTMDPDIYCLLRYILNEFYCMEDNRKR